jgi:hypothetical protein
MKEGVTEKGERFEQQQRDCIEVRLACMIDLDIRLTQFRLCKGKGQHLRRPNNKRSQLKLKRRRKRKLDSESAQARFV